MLMYVNAVANGLRKGRGASRARLCLVGSYNSHVNICAQLDTIKLYIKRSLSRDGAERVDYAIQTRSIPSITIGEERQYLAGQ